VASGTKHFRILIVAAESSDAETILKRLHADRLPVRGLFTQHPSKLPSRLREHQCDLLLVSVSESVKATEVASVFRRAHLHTPMLILDLDGHDAAGLVELMAAGAQGLIRDLDDGRLSAAVKHWIKQSNIGEHRSALRQRLEHLDETLQGLVQHCPGPVALMKGGVVADINPALITLLGLSDKGALIGQRLSAITTPEDAEDLDALLDRAQLLEVDNSIPDNIPLLGTDGSIINAKLSLYPIDLNDESRLAVFIQPRLTQASATSQLRENSELSSTFEYLAQSIGLMESEPPADRFSAETASAISGSTSIEPAPSLTREPVSRPEQIDDSGSRILEDSITASIERALETDGFSIMYQPIVSLMGDSQEHYSVLLRLRREHKGMLTANELLGPAARAGSLADIDRWVIQRALEEQGKRRRSGQKVACFLSLSAELVQDDRLLIWICDALRDFEVRGSWVTFQFQERDALALATKWNKLAEGLKKIKCRICINQFGMQENPKLAMTKMGADFVKFAPELAIGLANDPEMQRRLLLLIKMARDNKVKTIVTGVEDARSLALLWGAGIDYVQGNFLQGAMQGLDVPT
jgi:EAL domain-containing protein (putative c-di-GMP-specific phosphodiesterase class I)/PAS domain-containing protein